jgi:hypothetical protein
MDKWYRATEKLLYMYPGMEVRIEALNNQVDIVKNLISPRIVSRYEVIEGKSYRVGNAVEQATIERIESREIGRLQRKIRKTKSEKEVVERSLGILTEEEQLLVKMIYWDQLPWSDICDISGVSRNTFYEKKNKMVKKLAWCYGYLDDKAMGLKPVKKLGKSWEPRIG